MTTLFVATSGGHLSQLAILANRLPVDGEPVWVTHANEQSRSLLAGREVEFVPPLRPGNALDVARALPRAHNLHRRRRITRAYSTGSSLALAYLPYLAACGASCHYIESAARVQGPSRTGRLLQRVPGVRTYTQYQHWRDSRWRYGGSVLDRYRSMHATRELGETVHVVVTVGMSHLFPFKRLLDRLSALLALGGPLAQATGGAVEVLWQTGGTPVDDLPIRQTPFLSVAALNRALAAADIVVSHAGTGSALAVLESGRFPVLVARKQRYGEAVDDHQEQLADEVVRRRLGIRAEVDELTVEHLLISATSRVVANGTPSSFVLQ